MKSVNTFLRASAFALSIGTLTFGMVGCMPTESDSAGGTPEEYVYKGKPDQLLSEPAVNRSAKLSERFKLIQARE